MTSSIKEDNKDNKEIEETKNHEYKVKNYIISKTIGKGTFGKVKLATHVPTGERVQ